MEIHYLISKFTWNSPKPPGKKDHGRFSSTLYRICQYSTTKYGFDIDARVYSWFYRLVSFLTTVETTWLEWPWSIKWYTISVCPYSTTKYGLDIDALFIVGFTGWLFFHRGQNHLVRKTMVD